MRSPFLRSRIRIEDCAGLFFLFHFAAESGTQGDSRVEPADVIRAELPFAVPASLRVEQFVVMQAEMWCDFPVLPLDELVPAAARASL